MSTQMIIRIDKKMKDKFAQLARIEGKTTSQKIRELIEQYIQEHDISSYIDHLWDRIGQKLRAKGVTLDRIQEEIKAYRKKNG